MSINHSSAVSPTRQRLSLHWSGKSISLKLRNKRNKVKKEIKETVCFRISSLTLFRN